MVELWRFHQPAIVRDSEPSAKIFAITAKPIDEGFPLFFFFLFFFSSSLLSQSIFLPHSLFFIKMIHLAGIRITLNPIRSTYSKQLEASMKLSPLRNFRFYRYFSIYFASPSLLRLERIPFIRRI